MKQATHSRKTSLPRLFEHFVLMLILINVASFTITLLEASPRILLSNNSWTLQFIFPILYAFGQHILKSNSLITTDKRNIPNVFLLEQHEEGIKTEPTLKKMKKYDPHKAQKTIKKLTSID